MQQMMAISRAGHDKDNVYVIIREEATDVYLADGRRKTVDKPKRKSKKHIQIIRKLPEDISKILSQDKELRNEEIKRAIKLYQKSDCN